MSTRLVNVVADAADPPALARWWARALGWPVSLELPSEVDVAPEVAEPGVELVFVPVADEKVGKNRLHLDLRTGSLAEQRDLTQRLLDDGARRIDIGQPAGAPWVVMADPEGNEFCVLEPREVYADTGAIAAMVMDCSDPVALAGFWTAATGWPVRLDAGSKGVALSAAEGRGPWLELLPSTDRKQAKDRWHLDVAPYTGQDQPTEQRRLVDLGARPADVGQSTEATWVVLRDPDDHEFCILSAR